MTQVHAYITRGSYVEILENPTKSEIKKQIRSSQHAEVRFIADDLERKLYIFDSSTEIHKLAWANINPDRPWTVPTEPLRPSSRKTKTLSPELVTGKLVLKGRHIVLLGSEMGYDNPERYDRDWSWLHPYFDDEGYFEQAFNFI